MRRDYLEASAIIKGVGFGLVLAIVAFWLPLFALALILFG